MLRFIYQFFLLVSQHISANSYAVIRGYYYKLRKMCIKHLMHILRNL
jgi:hypothetical protein